MCQPPSRLVTLPAELQIKIVEELHEHPPCPYDDPLAKDSFLESVKAVRLTCRTLKAAASDVFLKTWFSHRSVVLERKSLLNLFQIANHPPFNTRISQIDVAVYQFLPELAGDFNAFLSRMEKETRDESCFLRHDRVKEHFLGDSERKEGLPKAKAAYEAYKKYIEDQTELYQKFVHVRLLARALKSLSGLSGLRTISVNGSQSPLTGAWTSGILSKCGISLFHKEKIALHPATMASVIRAMHLSNVELCTLVASGLNVSALQLSGPQRQRFSKVGLGHLHNLSLRLLDPKTFPSETSSALFRSGLLSRFIKQAHNLVNLCIEFYNQPYDVPLNRLLGSRIEKLETLSLGGLSYHADDLIEWLTMNSSKLDNLQLDYSSLMTGTWRDVFRKMRSNLHLKSVYFHFLADDEESIHLTGDNVNNFILKKSSSVDWDTMESKKLPANMGDLAGLFSVVVNGHAGDHHHHHHHHHHGPNDTSTATQGNDNGHGQTQQAPVVAGPSVQPNHATTIEEAVQDDHATSGLAPPPGHPANPSVPDSTNPPGIVNGTLTLPMPPPHVMNAMQDLFQSALGLSLDFIDEMDEEDEDDLLDSLDDEDDDDDDDDFLDEEGSEEDSGTEEDDEEDDSETSDEEARQDCDGYQTDDSEAEDIIDQMIQDM